MTVKNVGQATKSVRQSPTCLRASTHNPDHGNESDHDSYAGDDFDECFRAFSREHVEHAGDGIGGDYYADGRDHGLSQSGGI